MDLCVRWHCIGMKLSLSRHSLTLYSLGFPRTPDFLIDKAAKSEMRLFDEKA